MAERMPRCRCIFAPDVWIHSGQFCVLCISGNGTVILDSHETSAGLPLYCTNCVVNIQLQRLFRTQSRWEVETKSSSDQLPFGKRRRCQSKGKGVFACLCSNRSQQHAPPPYVKSLSLNGPFVNCGNNSTGTTRLLEWLK